MKSRLFTGVETFSDWKIPLLTCFLFVLCTVFFQVFLFGNTTANANASLPPAAMYVCWEIMYALLGLVFGFVFVFKTRRVYQFIGYGALVCAVVILGIQFAAYANLVTGAQLVLLGFLFVLVLWCICWEITYDKSIARFPTYAIALCFGWFLYLGILYITAAGTSAPSLSTTTTTLHGDLVVTGTIFSNLVQPLALRVDVFQTSPSRLRRQERTIVYDVEPLTLDTISTTRKNSKIQNVDQLPVEIEKGKKKVQQQRYEEKVTTPLSSIGTGQDLYDVAYVALFTDNILSISDGNIRDAHTVTSSTFTDGVLTISDGIIQNAILVNTTLSVSTLTDGTASLTGGSLTDVSFLEALTLTDGVTDATWTDGELLNFQHMNVFGNTVVLVRQTLSPSFSYNFTSLVTCETDEYFSIDWTSQIRIDGVSSEGITVTFFMNTNPIPYDYFFVQNNGANPLAIIFVVPSGIRRTIPDIEPGYGVQISTVPASGSIFDVSVTDYQGIVAVSAGSIFTNDAITMYRGQLTDASLVQSTLSESETMTDYIMSITSGYLTSAQFISSLSFTDGTASLADGDLSQVNGVFSTTIENTDNIITNTMDVTGVLTAASVDLSSSALSSRLVFPSLAIADIVVGSFNSTDYATTSVGAMGTLITGLNIAPQSQLPFDRSWLSFEWFGTPPFGIVLTLAGYDGDAGDYYGVRMVSQNLNNVDVDTGGNFSIRWTAIVMAAV